MPTPHQPIADATSATLRIAFTEADDKQSYAYELDLRTRKVRCLTCQWGTGGLVTRIYYLPDENFLIEAGPDDANTELYWMPASLSSPPQALEAKAVGEAPPPGTSGRGSPRRVSSRWSPLATRMSGFRTDDVRGRNAGIPSITDLVTSTAVASIRNNGQRRFFQPWLIDGYGDRGAYQGQQLNAGDGSPGSVSDPNWNGRSQAAWSPDGTKIVYWQSIVTAPGCGGQNPLPCPESTEPGGRRTRLMIAHLPGREPLPITSEPVTPISDVVPWGTPYTPGDPHPTRPYPREGNSRCAGRCSAERRSTSRRTANALPSRPSRSNTPTIPTTVFASSTAPRA